MRKEDILSDIGEVCKTVFNDETLVVTQTTSANDIGNWDSMTNLFLIDAIEKKFNVKFSVDDVFNSQNIGDLCNVIMQRKSL